MTIHQTASRVQYIGDNSQTEFTVDFRFFTDDNLKVYLDGVLQASGYTVANSGTETCLLYTSDAADDLLQV